MLENHRNFHSFHKESESESDDSDDNNDDNNDDNDNDPENKTKKNQKHYDGNACGTSRGGWTGEHFRDYTYRRCLIMT